MPSVQVPFCVLLLSCSTTSPQTMTSYRHIVAVTLVSACVATCGAAPGGSPATTASTSETDALARAALEEAGCEVTRAEGRVLWVRCGDSGDGSINLQNADLIVKGMPTKEQRAAAVRDFVRAIAPGKGEPFPASPPLADLRLAIKTQETVAATEERIPPDQREQRRLVQWPLAVDLVVLAAIDRPATIAMVTQATAAGWGMKESDIYARALENLDAHPLTPKCLDSEAERMCMLEDPADTYESSRLLSPRARASLEEKLGGPALFAIPDRDHLLAVRKDDARSVAKLRLLAGKTWQGAYGITPALFEVGTDGTLRVAP